MQAEASGRLRELIVGLSGNPVGELSLATMAARAGMSERTFSRVFKKETGMSPAGFVEAARVDRAKTLLEASDWPLARVAERAGFGSISGLHRGFQKFLGVTPNEYRARFGPAKPGA